MNKVYVLTIDDNDTQEKERTLETLVFGSLEKAKNYLEQLKYNFLCDNNIDEEDSIIEEEEMSWSWYNSWGYNHNHYSLHIEEKEIL